MFEMRKDVKRPLGDRYVNIIFVIPIRVKNHYN